MVDFDKEMQIDRAIRDRISDIQKRHPHADLGLARRMALRDTVREIDKLRAERDEAVALLRVYPRRHRDVAPEWADRVEALLARYDAKKEGDA